MKDSCEFQPIKFRSWLSGCMCWYTKAGFLLVLAGGGIAYFTDWKIPGSGWPLGYGLLSLGAFVLLISLIRDIRLIFHKRNHKG